LRYTTEHDGVIALGNARKLLPGSLVMADLDRITHDALVMGGQACIRGMRVTVRMIVGQINAGHSIEDILSEYPYLEREDIEQALRFTEQRAISQLGPV
jgi:uncharacterized protein (DUF433 family)